MPRKPAPRRRGRPPGHSAPRLMKRIVIAGAVLQRVEIAQVARDLGVSRSWASREAHHPETQKLIGDFTVRYGLLRGYAQESLQPQPDFKHSWPELASDKKSVAAGVVCDS